MKLDRILLMGNPNVGKSALFSRLTGAKVIVSNYPNTTVEFYKGRMKIAEKNPELIDVPGTYSLEAKSKAEEVATSMLKEGDVIINVINATNLERNLYLTLQLLEKNIPMILVLNMWDETKHMGITIDVQKLEEKLGIPVVSTCSLTGEGIKTLVQKLQSAKAPKLKQMNEAGRWQKIGEIVDSVQTLVHKDHTLLNRIGDLSIKPLTGLPIAALVLFVSFWIIRFVGESLINYVFDPLFQKIWTPFLIKTFSFLNEGNFIREVLIGSFINGQIDFGLSFGLLTTGLYVPIVMVLPYIFSFYLVLGILEDLGYLPRLAVLMDNFLHHLGLHGYATIPLILGLGCNVPGALAIRMLEGRREKFIAATLMAVAVPCMAQIAMIVGLVGQRGGEYVALIFGILFVILVVKGILMNKLMKGQSPEIFVEIPPYRMPQAHAVLKKLWFRVFGFLKEALPYVLLGVLIVNILYSLKIIAFISELFSPVLVKLWGLPKEAMGALIVGFLRKDVAIGMLGPLGLTTKQLVIGSTILAIYFPCIATFTVLIKELGIKDMLKSMAIMIFVALFVGTILNLFLPI